MSNKKWTEAVIRVGDGRGFVVEGRGRYGRQTRYVVTAAHCLPNVPPAHGGSYTAERTYQDLLAPLGKQPSVWCECLFADPIADIAVLGSPDNQELSEQADAYEELVEATTPLSISEPPSKPIPEEVARFAQFESAQQWAARECPAFLLSLSNHWFSCKVQHFPNGMLIIRDAAEGIAGGMSGSPIVPENGAAIGIVCIGSVTHDRSNGPNLDAATEGGPNPRLMGNLPGWLLKELAAL